MTAPSKPKSKPNHKKPANRSEPVYPCVMLVDNVPTIIHNSQEASAHGNGKRVARNYTHDVRGKPNWPEVNLRSVTENEYYESHWACQIDSVNEDALTVHGGGTVYLSKELRAALNVHPGCWLVRRGSGNRAFYYTLSDRRFRDRFSPMKTINDKIDDLTQRAAAVDSTKALRRQAVNALGALLFQEDSPMPIDLRTSIISGLTQYVANLGMDVSLGEGKLTVRANVMHELLGDEFRTALLSDSVQHQVKAFQAEFASVMVKFTQAMADTSKLANEPHGDAPDETVSA